MWYKTIFLITQFFYEKQEEKNKKNKNYPHKNDLQKQDLKIWYNFEKFKNQTSFEKKIIWH